MRTVLIVIFTYYLCINFFGSFKKAFETKSTKEYILRLLDCLLEACMAIIFIILMRTT